MSSGNNGAVVLMVESGAAHVNDANVALFQAAVLFS